MIYGVTITVGILVTADSAEDAKRIGDDFAHNLRLTDRESVFSLKTTVSEGKTEAELLKGFVL